MQTGMGSARRVSLLLCLMLGAFGVAAASVVRAEEPPPHGEQPAAHGARSADAGHDAHAAQHHDAPHLVWTLPFVALLLCIAILPLIHRTEHWWHRNGNKLIVALSLAAVTLLYYLLRGSGFGHGDHAAGPGLPTVLAVLNHAIIADYVPFIVLLFSLFTISGGINLRGDIPAHPATNTLIIGIGAGLASFIGTTGASMVLIRPLLQINRERDRKVHTVIFFIFAVSNCGGLLLPIGDPPLFLGYLRGVPFFWTFKLVAEWAVCVAILLVVYYAFDRYAWKHETRKAIALDERIRQPLVIRGLALNLPLLLGVIAAVALLVPGKEVPGTGWVVPAELPVVGHLIGLRELVQLALAGISMAFTAREVRLLNEFDFFAITEVACLFVGIFVTMHVPIEIRNAKGPELGSNSPIRFFWATGLPSSFLDNAPTYVVFFETAKTLTECDVPGAMKLLDGSCLDTKHLIALSCGAVFMGANTYIGNGPNFMVKAIAEQSGVKMPSFFGYMIYSVGILIPIFLLLTWLFMR